MRTPPAPRVTAVGGAVSQGPARSEAVLDDDVLEAKAEPDRRPVAVGHEHLDHERALVDVEHVVGDVDRVLDGRRGGARRGDDRRDVEIAGGVADSPEPDLEARGALVPEPCPHAGDRGAVGQLDRRVGEVVGSGRHDELATRSDLSFALRRPHVERRGRDRELVVAGTTARSDQRVDFVLGVVAVVVGVVVVVAEDVDEDRDAPEPVVDAELTRVRVDRDVDGVRRGWRPWRRVEVRGLGDVAALRVEAQVGLLGCTDGRDVGGEPGHALRQLAGAARAGAVEGDRGVGADRGVVGQAARLDREERGDRSVAGIGGGLCDADAAGAERDRDGCADRSPT